MALQLSERVHNLEDNLQAAAHRTAEALQAAQQSAVDRTRSAAKATDGFVRDHPWATVGIAVGVGALIGWLISRD